LLPFPQQGVEKLRDAMGVGLARDGCLGFYASGWVRRWNASSPGADEFMARDTV
jgi:hypothetical protein